MKLNVTQETVCTSTVGNFAKILNFELRSYKFNGHNYYIFKYKVFYKNKIK
jgi:hypothetical protein